MENEANEKGWFARNWKWLIPAGGLGAILLCVGCVALMVTIVFGTIKSSDVYQQALSRTQENAQAIEALGSPIEPGLWVSGTIEVSGPSGSADIAIPVSGPRGSGTLYAVAEKSAGEWRFNTLELDTENANERIDILGRR
ncbi:MAG: cytochrome c oxidase assembly factor 1 family protein [Chloroflexota bacterium]